MKYYFREIGDGGWIECSKSFYDYAKTSPELDYKAIEE